MSLMKKKGWTRVKNARRRLLARPESDQTANRVFIQAPGQLVTPQHWADQCVPFCVELRLISHLFVGIHHPHS